MVLPLKWAVGSSIPASLNFARPLSVTTTPRIFGSRWLASESRKSCREPVQHFVLCTSISTVTNSLTRLMASTADRFIAHSYTENVVLQNVIYECDFPVWPQFPLLNWSEPPLGIVRVFHFSPA